MAQEPPKQNQGSSAPAKDAAPAAPRLQKAPFTSEKTVQERTRFANQAERKPADELEHFKNRECAEGHSNWKRGDIKHSVDHHAFCLFCLDCQDWYILPTGGLHGMLDTGMVEATTNAKA